MSDMNRISEESLDTIISVLVNSRIEAEKYNKNGINDSYIKSVDKALEELKPFAR